MTGASRICIAVHDCFPHHVRMRPVLICVLVSALLANRHCPGAEWMWSAGGQGAGTAELRGEFELGELPAGGIELRSIGDFCRYRIEINGELATHHIYSFNELEALQKGGVQRAYTGNVTTGNHEMMVTVIGKTDGGKDFTRSETFAFSKGVKPKTLGITLAEPGLGNDGIQFGDW